MRRWLGLLGAGILVLVAGCSGTPSAQQKAVTPSLPMGWKTVTYHGLRIDVPRDWTVEPWHPNCGVSNPTVFMGPEGISVLYCGAFVPGGAEVILGARGVGHESSAPETINGVGARVSRHEVVYNRPLSGTLNSISVRLTSISVRLPAQGLSISVSCGESGYFPGGAPGRADQIVRTVHLVR